MLGGEGERGGFFFVYAAMRMESIVDVLRYVNVEVGMSECRPHVECGSCQGILAFVRA